MTSAYTSPALRHDRGLQLFSREIDKFPILEISHEISLARRWMEHGDLDAAGTLVTSHLRLVVKIAFLYRNYGLPLSD
jgi:RNA polymerase sigma-32 factor